MKIALVNHDDWSVWLFRRGIIKRLLSAGHEVHVLCDNGVYVDKIKQLGATHVQIDIPRFVTPWRDMKCIISMLRIFKRNRYDIVHLFHIKILAYGVISAKLAGIKQCVGSSTGAGILLNDFSGPKKLILQCVVRFLYSQTIPRLDKILFQNEADRQYFCRAGFAKIENTVLVKGSGVDLNEYSEDMIDQQALSQLMTKCGDLSERVVVTMVGRAVETKGVREFIEASKIIERTNPGEAIFLLFGDIEHGNPETLSADYLRSNNSSAFHWLGHIEHAREALAISDIVVLPSYREGTPRTLLEAMSMHKPIVTTDAPGCDNVIEDGRNGFMVPVKDTKKLAKAILDLVNNREMREAYGRRSYEKVCEEFEEGMIAKAIIEKLYAIRDYGSESKH